MNYMACFITGLMHATLIPSCLHIFKRINKSIRGTKKTKMMCQYAILLQEIHIRMEISTIRFTIGNILLQYTKCFQEQRINIFDLHNETCLVKESWFENTIR